MPAQGPARGRTETTLVTRVTLDGAANGPAPATARRPDDLVVEEPLRIELDGVAVATTMRTPGHDYELAVGFCHGDGLLAGAPVTGVRYCANGSADESAWNIVTVETGGRAPAPTPRLGTTSSSCGLCGNDAIDDLCKRLVPLAAGTPVHTLEVLAGVPARVRDGQGLFARTGAVHAAAAFGPDGEILLTR